jgi:HEAT repeat protein
MRTFCILFALIAVSLSGCTSESTVAGKTFSSWVGQLKDSDAGRRRAAVEALGEMGIAAKSALPELRSYIVSETDALARCEAIRLLGRVGDASDMTTLANLAKDSHDKSRVCAVAALNRFGKAAVPVLAEVLSDPDPSVRKEAARRLMTLGADAKDAEPLLAKAVNDSDAEVAELAKLALERIHEGRAPSH